MEGGLEVVAKKKSFAVLLGETLHQDSSENSELQLLYSVKEA